MHIFAETPFKLPFMQKFNFDTISSIVIGGSACENLDGIAAFLGNVRPAQKKTMKLLGIPDDSPISALCLAVIGPFEINGNNLEVVRHEMEKINTLLSKNSSRLVLINAEYDDPELLVSVCEGLSNIHPCIGNGIIRTKSSTLLAIGGGVPLGAKWRSEHGYNSFEFLPSVNIEEIASEKIQDGLMILSSYPPTFCSEIPPVNSDWVMQDPSVRRKFLDSTFEMDKLYHYIVSAGINGVKWFANCNSEKMKSNDVTIIDKASFETYNPDGMAMKASFKSGLCDINTVEVRMPFYHDYEMRNIEVEVNNDNQVRRG